MGAIRPFNITGKLLIYIIVLGSCNSCFCVLFVWARFFGHEVVSFAGGEHFYVLICSDINFCLIVSHLITGSRPLYYVADAFLHIANTGALRVATSLCLTNESLEKRSSKTFGS